MTFNEEKFVRSRHWFWAAVILMLGGVLYMGLAPAAEAATPRVSTQPTVEVDVVLKTDKAWTHRKATVNAFSDGKIALCEEFKDNVVAQCVVLVEDGDVLMMSVRLLEDKI